MKYVLIDTANLFFRARHVAFRAADEWEKALAMPAMFRGRPAVKMGTSSGLRPSTPNSSAGTPMGTPRPTLIMKQDDSL